MAAPMKFPAIVKRIINHGRQTYTLMLRPGCRVPNYRPGQFTHLAIDPYDPSSHWPESRVFSIATGPCRRHESLRLTYTVVGHYTKRMEVELREGSEVWLKLPYGDFTLKEDSTMETVLIAGGTGFTPFAAFLEHIIEKETIPPLRIAYGAANEELLVYRELVEEAVSKIPKLRRQYYLESGGGQDIIPGLIVLEQLLKMVDQPESAIYYISGPKVMIYSLRAKLLDKGYADEIIRIDAWD